MRNALNLLNRFFRDAVKDSYVRHSPMVGVDKPEISRKRKGRALLPEEIQALLANCESPDTRLITLTAVLTGMRRGEVFGLRWADVDWQANVIHVIFAADVSGSLEDVTSQDTAVRGHRAFRPQELDSISLHPPIQRFLQRWQPGDPAVYLGEMWVS